jgi:hypothetical protein
MSTEEMFVPREIHYNIYDMVQESFTYELNLPDIETVKSYHPRDNSPYLLVECEPRKRYAGGCPTCHSSRISAHGSMKHPRYIHDINAG